MDTISLTDIKTRGAKAIPDDRTSYLIVNSKLKSAIVPIASYIALLAALEELEDIKAIEARKDEETIGTDDVFGAR